MAQEPRMDLRIPLEEIIHSGRERIGDFSNAGCNMLVLFLRESRYFERSIQKVAGQFLLAANFGGPPQRVNVRIFDLLEIVLSLGISIPKHAACISWSIDVRNAIGIPIYRNFSRQLVLLRVRPSHFPRQMCYC